MSAIHVALPDPNVERQATTSASGVISRSRRNHRLSRATCNTSASPTAAISCFEMDVAATSVAHFSGIEGLLGHGLQPVPLGDLQCIVHSNPACASQPIDIAVK